MPSVIETLKRFGEWVKAVEQAEGNGLSVVCDAKTVRKFYEDFSNGIGGAMNVSLRAIISAQQERDRLLKK